MDFLQLMQQRYTTKYYDPDKKVPEETMQKILECIRLTPSAVNMQPWHFFLLSGNSKQKLVSVIPDFNVQRYQSCSHVLLIAAKNPLNDEDIRAVCNNEDECGRFTNPEKENAANAFKGKKHFADLHWRTDGYGSWCGKQCYIALGSALYAAAAYGVDSTPVEGFNAALTDELLDLRSLNLQSQVLVLFGYRSAQDSNTLDKRPKARFALKDILTVL